ncbi:MAG: tetratricopeptide repeat protein, partial [Candidatus Aminicenantes bacterium]|nr:tetratricopeptide repeat protein [Candidatus Aminicenantes bacterium]
MAGKFFGKKGLVVSGMILFFFFCAILLAQENQTNDDKKLRGEILTVFKDNGEKGLRNFIKDRLSHISKKFILDLAESGVKERKEKWLNISKILAEEKKDEKILAEILFKLGYYFRLVSNHHKSREYLGKALPIYMKLNDFAGQGNIYLEKGTILFADGDTSGALNLYEEAMVLFQKGEHLVGQGNFYLRKGIIYHYTGDNAQALLQYDNALPFFEKSGHHLGQGNIYFKKGEIYYYTGDNVKAMVLYKKALNFYKQVREPMSLGNVYRRIA